MAGERRSGIGPLLNHGTVDCFYRHPLRSKIGTPVRPAKEAMDDFSSCSATVILFARNNNSVNDNAS